MNRKRMELIAEIGTAHQGDLGRAEKLIRQAGRAGADCLKFQIVLAREILHPDTGLVELPGGATPLYEVFQSLEREDSFYSDLKSMTEAEGLEFLATPFGLESAALLRELSPRRVKIASPEVNHLPLLRDVSSWGVPVLLSSGVSLLGDLEEALDILGRESTTILHCVTSYPAPEEDYNLNLLPHLSGLMGVPVGVSDHTLDPLLIPSLAFMKGAGILEKHFTLDRKDPGLDDPIALDPGDFRKMRDFLDKLADFDSSAKVLKSLQETFGTDRMQSALGRGVKTLADSERQNYGLTNRSIHVTRELHPGMVLKQEDLAVLRTEKILHPGLHPRYLELLPGKIVKRFIPSGEGLVWEDVLEKGD